MRHGPVEVLAIAFPTPRLDAAVLGELRRLTGSGVLRVLDARFVVRTLGGIRHILDLDEFDPAARECLGNVDPATCVLIDRSDIETVYDGMVPDSGVLLVVLQHVWATGLQSSIEQAGGELAMSVHVPFSEVESKLEAARREAG
jgi:hypothetical protein